MSDLLKTHTVVDTPQSPSFSFYCTIQDRIERIRFEGQGNPRKGYISYVPPFLNCTIVCSMVDMRGARGSLTKLYEVSGVNLQNNDIYFTLGFTLDNMELRLEHHLEPREPIVELTEEVLTAPAPSNTVELSATGPLQKSRFLEGLEVDREKVYDEALANLFPNLTITERDDFRRIQREYMELQRRYLDRLRKQNNSVTADDP